VIHVISDSGGGGHRARQTVRGAGTAGASGRHLFFGEFRIDGDAHLQDVGAMYGFKSIPILPRERCRAPIKGVQGPPVVGDRTRLEGVELVVREMRGKTITKVGLRFAQPEAE